MKNKELVYAVMWYSMVMILAVVMRLWSNHKTTGPMVMLNEQGCQYEVHGKFLIPIFNDKNERVCL